MLRFVIIVSVLIAAATAATITPISSSQGPGIEGAITQCGSSGEVLGIRVTGCTALPCNLKVGDVVTAEADFKPAKSHDVLTVSVTVIKDGIPVPFLSTDVATPVKQGEMYTVSLPLLVTDTFGTGPLNIKIQAAEGGIIEVCGEATSIIEDR